MRGVARRRPLIVGLLLKTPEAFLLPPIPRDAYREIIETPLAVANQAGMRLSIDPLLVDELVRASDGADALPLLAFTLRQILAEHRVGAQAQLTLAQYRTAGEIDGVLARRLAATQRTVNSTPQDLKRLFIPQLATWDDTARPPGAKRLVADEAMLLAGDRMNLSALTNALVEARLLSRSGDESGRATIEVAHEALLRLPPLSGWLEDDREFLIWRDRVGHARSDFVANTRGLLAGRELQIARTWLDTRAPDIAALDRRFVEESVVEADRRRTDEEAQQHRRQAAELEAVQAREKAAQQMAVASRRAARRTLAGLAAALVLAVLAGSFGWYALQQKGEAIETLNQALLTQSKYLADAAKQATEQDKDPSTGMLLALEALRDTSSDDESTRNRPFWAPAAWILVEARRQLREFAQLKGQTAPVNSVAVTPDGTRIVTGSWDNTARIWEVFPDGQMMIDQAKTVAPRCLTAEQRQRFHLSPKPPSWCNTSQKWPADSQGPR